ncbi:RNA polymerase sigma factor (sigma-70 family) [Aeromicrobium panaciterrae]|uniref:RNA polymerase sigma factor (Sigma-70 family) n=1 Tax=Aeromicrobium panaciterrae TaxID=363861 RepID=A0ABU1UNE6_9ACTN|nr:sigma-70 family RNA polymerase sigma factor [Aeromicrobium panaciterrae]MDR7086709.1 RNA polymerase sigma factor (sigma-70 family) [Aeromicrobium panaciterrae]
MTSATGSAAPTDAELVAGVLAADREAFAAVYDKYGNKLYDFAYSMLRQREDAADAVADSFVIVAERINQLREADRLRPWLYSIVRSECLRTLRARKRVDYGGEEQLINMADDALTPDQEAERSAAQKIVWDAAAGLAERDRALLDLHLRQGLEGAELGEAMGVSAANAYTMLNRLRAQVDRSLGALLIARLGRDDCDELDELLADWDGTFSPLIRKRVSRHVDDCDVCGERRKKILSPWMLLAGVPMFAAPAFLRDRVIQDTQLVAYTTPSGEPLTTTTASAPAKGKVSTKTKVAGAAVAAVVLIGGTAATVALQNDDSPKDIAASSATPTPSPTPTESIASPSAKPVEPGTLTLSTTAIALGRSASNSTFVLTNTGGKAVNYQLTSSAGWLTASPSTGKVKAGKAVQIAVHANRGAVAEGKSAGTIGVSWGAGSGKVAVTLTQERNPNVGRPSAGDSPTCEDPTVPVRATVTDESGLSSVRLRWSVNGQSGTETMHKEGSRWVAQMGPVNFGGKVTMRVVATDTRGNSATGPAGSVQATPCPG